VVWFQAKDGPSLLSSFTPARKLRRRHCLVEELFEPTAETLADLVRPMITAASTGIPAGWVIVTPTRPREPQGRIESEGACDELADFMVEQAHTPQQQSSPATESFPALLRLSRLDRLRRSLREPS
jgi:hypothetical protein